jgi:hypothetical protein
VPVPRLSGRILKQSDATEQATTRATNKVRNLICGLLRISLNDKRGECLRC